MQGKGTMHQTQDRLEAARAQFPALKRSVNGRPVVYFDGPGGTQVPQRVIAAIGDYLANRNANHEGRFLTSQESDQMLHEAHRVVAALLGARDPECICFGPNMTTLTMGLSRALGKTWQPGDEIIVTRLDHDANVTPWVLAAQDAGARVQFVDVNPEDCTLDLDQFRGLLSDRTRLVAVGCASNATGTINPVKQIIGWAHEAGALVFLDAVHYAPHALVDVEAWGCDFLACSAYKFFGPHIGILWGRRDLLESLPAYKLRPVPDRTPDRWMTGTQNHECVAGTIAAVEYLAELGTSGASVTDEANGDLRGQLRAAYDTIHAHERQLALQLLAGLKDNSDVKVWGITAADRIEQRFPTVSITHGRWTATELAEKLGAAGIFVWHGNYYALQLTEALGLEPEGMVRIGAVHYNTREEVDRFLEELAGLQ